VQDPQIYINELGVELNCCVEPERLAIINSSHQVFIGFESFFFANSENMEQFLEEPYRYCGKLTDPVSKERFTPSDNSPTATYNGRQYVFASASTHSMFEAMPEMHYLPNYKMLPNDTSAN
jgi:YHS domain-containing protein